MNNDTLWIRCCDFSRQLKVYFDLPIGFTLDMLIGGWGVVRESPWELPKLFHADHKLEIQTLQRIHDAGFWWENEGHWSRLLTGRKFSTADVLEVVKE